MAKHKLSYALPVAVMAMGAFAAMPTAVMAGTSTWEYRTLDNNENACYTISAGDQVEIDLNGYSITCANGSAITVEKGATLVVKDSKNIGEVISETGGAAVFNKGGNVKIENGNYLAKNWYTIKNLGTMEINGGEIGGTEHKNNSSLVDNGWYDGTSTTGHINDKGVAHGDGEIAVLTINGGMFTHLNTTSTIKSDDYSKTTINNGTFESAQGNLVQATGDVTINNGKFTGYGTMIAFNGDGSDIYPGKAEINGGTIDAKYVATSHSTNATLKITGGEFSGLEGVVRGDTSTFNGEGITGGIFNIAPETLLAEKYNYGKTKDGDFVVLNPAALEKLDSDGYELDDEHNVVPKKIDYQGETKGSDAAKAEERGEIAIEGSVEFIGDVEIDRNGYFLITDHGTNGLTPKATSSDSKLVAAFDLNMYDRNDEVVKVSDTEMKVKIALTEEQYNQLKQYDSVVAVYFDEEGNETEERIAATLVEENGNYYVVFTVTHFSTYGIIGVNEEATATTPETGTMTAAGASAANAGILAAATAGVISAIVGIAAIIRRK